MSEGVDYSWARPGGAALKAAGKQFAVRYLYPDGQGGKGLDASELADLRAHDIAVAVVYESSANRALAGRAAGAADARSAQAQLVAVGLPESLPIYFGVDFNATAGQQAAIDEYLRGAADVIGLARVGVYAGIGPIERCQANGTASWFWQTYAWSAGRVAAGIHLYQYRNGQTINGGAVDFCRSLTDDFGQDGDGGIPSTAASSATVGHNVSTWSTRQIQEALIALSYDLGPSAADDDYGRYTTSAVRQFEIDQKLSVDVGIAGPQVVARLSQLLHPANGTPAPAPAKPAALAKPAGLTPPPFPLPKGSYFGPEGGPAKSVSGYHGHGQDLAVWQQRMKDRRWKITPDGLYGPRGAKSPKGQTASVALAFQKEKGLTPDALIGPETWAAAWTAPVTA